MRSIASIVIAGMLAGTHVAGFTFFGYKDMGRKLRAFVRAIA